MIFVIAGLIWIGIAIFVVWDAERWSSQNKIMENDKHPPRDNEADADGPAPASLTVPEPNSPRTKCCPQEKADKFERAFLVLTFLAASAAAFFTGKAWLTADDQEHRQLRAYVIVKDAKFEKLENGHFKTSDMYPDGQYELYIDYDLVNEGQTPAYEIKRVIDVIYPFPGPLTFRYEQPPLAYMPKELGFGPVVTRHFSKQEIAEIEAGARHIAFVGQIRYHDIFGVEWPTNFCFLHAKWPQGVGFAFCPNVGPVRLNYAR